MSSTFIQHHLCDLAALRQVGGSHGACRRVTGVSMESLRIVVTRQAPPR